ncbi:unnamed protein product [Symbiodinium natans]|uniref:ATP-dependent RNA helicase n=1 Tax=Symbiodinium natans TaxID=878477 RepID=A0A812RSQ6_9DINO|nr:unnamed protein product [Symbiodinium natans]
MAAPMLSQQCAATIITPSFTSPPSFLRVFLHLTLPRCKFQSVHIYVVGIVSCRAPPAKASRSYQAVAPEDAGMMAMPVLTLRHVDAYARLRSAHMRNALQADASSMKKRSEQRAHSAAQVCDLFQVRGLPRPELTPPVQLLMPQLQKVQKLTDIDGKALLLSVQAGAYLPAVGSIGSIPSAAVNASAAARERKFVEVLSCFCLQAGGYMSAGAAVDASVAAPTMKLREVATSSPAPMEPMMVPYFVLRSFAILTDMFDRLDANHDGVLSRAEWQGAMQAMQGPATDCPVCGNVFAYDSVEIGGRSTVCFDLFLTYLGITSRRRGSSLSLALSSHASSEPLSVDPHDAHTVVLCNEDGNGIPCTSVDAVTISVHNFDLFDRRIRILQVFEKVSVFKWHGNYVPAWSRTGKVAASGVVKPVRSSKVFAETTFADFPIDDRLRKGLEATLGKSHLTPVQHEVLSRHLAEKEAASARQADLLLQAPTGTGKTIAFLLPTLQRLLLLEDARCAGRELPEGVLALVLAPTRELALQSAKVASRLLQYSGGLVRSSFVAGSFSLEEDVRRLREDAPQLLFATPWRLARHLQTTPHFVRALQSVELLVLDEADRLLDPSFVYKVDYLIRCLPTPRPRMLLCSATFSEPIRKFAIRSLRANLETISIGSKEPSLSQAATEVATPVHQVLVKYNPGEFLATLHAVLEQEMGQEGDMRRVLVVFPTVRWLQFFYVLLKHRANMPGLFALHRSLSDDRRRARALRFSKGAPPIRGALFATDLASRGMDFDVHAVIQVGPPSDREQYIHRAGRTGRLASQGRSVLLLNPVEMTVLQELGMSAEEVQVQAASSFECALSSIRGWWEDASMSASGHLFFASAIAFYLNESQRLRARAVDVVQTVAALLQSTGLPQDYGLPAIPRGLAARLREKDELVAVRTETVRERWDVLSALGPGTMRKPTKPANVPEADKIEALHAQQGAESKRRLAFGLEMCSCRSG